MTVSKIAKPTREKIARALSQPSLTAELKEEDLLAALREENVTTLEQLVSRVVGQLRDRAPNEKPVHTDAFLIEHQRRQEREDLPIKHGRPKMAVVVDGVEYDPHDISRFDGRPLHFIPDLSVAGEQRLTAYTNDEPILTALKASRALDLLSGTVQLNSGAIRPNRICGGIGSDGMPFYYECPSGGTHPYSPPPQPPSYSKTVQMFSDVEFKGDWFWLNQGFSWPNLLKVHRNTVLVFSGDWNDQISSISGTSGPVTYSEHINFAGSKLTIPSWQINHDLNALGWNDRISSVQYWA